MDDERIPQVAPEPSVPVVPVRPRRRGRTTLLIACAALLGAVAGVCTGYVVQADRKPTALPPLSLAVVGQAKGEGPKPAPRAQDGDLRKLLAPRPAGTQKSDARQGWLNEYDFANGFKDPRWMFGQLAEGGFRRATIEAWRRGRSTTEVQLIQFRDDTDSGSRKFLDGQQSYMDDSDWAGNEGVPLTGSGNGRVYVFDKPSTKAGYLPMYQARALAARGDIVMDIRVYDTRPIPEKTVMSLAKRQLERL
ncbi:hypothetical protein ACFC4G_28950 [Streptomyces sp. NPDC056002]|uniref:hypothetical protein n=1 Tax=Streptomyces sp. NPDC056002 TaxID=3345675 RepID=UPI0035E39533